MASPCSWVTVTVTVTVSPLMVIDDEPAKEVMPLPSRGSSFTRAPLFLEELFDAGDDDGSEVIDDEPASLDEVTEKLVEAFNDIVESPEQYLMPNVEVSRLMAKHVPLMVVATFTVVEENWQ